MTYDLDDILKDITFYETNTQLSAPQVQLIPVSSLPFGLNQRITRRSPVLAPNHTELVDIRKLRLPPDTLYQIYVGGLPSGATEAELHETFRFCGEIKNIYRPATKNFAFVNYVRKEGAMNALTHRDFFVRNEKVSLAGFHRNLQIILRRIPPQVCDEKAFQKCIQGFLNQRFPNIFVYSQLRPAQFGSSAYLHFLSIDDSIDAFEALKGPEFTKAAIKELYIIADADSAVVVTNEEVNRRSESGQAPNQNLGREVLQFLCVRYVEQTLKPHVQTYDPSQQVSQFPQQQNNSYMQMQNKQSDICPIAYQQSETSVYICAMPLGTVQQTVQDAMLSFGQVQAVQLINSLEVLGKPPYAIVYFANKDSVGRALAAGSVVVKGQTSLVRPHIHKSK